MRKLLEYLKRHDEIIQWISGLGIPIAIGFSSWLITTSIESAKIDSEYVKIALNILANDQKNNSGNNNGTNQDQLALKNWAVRLLNKKSPEKFNAEEQTALLNGNLAKPIISQEAMDLLGFTPKKD